jgi:hypothetical protein
MSKASSFLRLIIGAAKSNTIQFNSLMAAIWAAILQMDAVQSNPEYLAILGGIQALVNLLLRAKTKKALADR